MSLMKARIHLFSGTGNTKRAAALAEERLRLAGWETTVSNMEKVSPDAADAALHLVLYPMYGFGAPALVTKYVKRLIAPEGARAAVIAIGGSENGASGDEGISLYRMTALLKKRGFSVSFTTLASYPNNWTQFFNPPSPEVVAQICEQADRQIQEAADRIARGTVCLKKKSVPTRLLLGFLYLGYHHIGRRILGKLFIADSRCSGCSRCARTCPASAIAMKRGKPVWNWSCEGCQRCINTCPEEAIQSSSGKLAVLTAASLIPLWPAIVLGRSLAWPALPSFLAGTIGYIALTFLFLWVADRLLRAGEACSPVRRLLTAGPSRRYRRYRGPGPSA
ncbi:EFR1 family ferrodoxin [Gorillibacterium timonense]|uniref:EFR1 family ferrodoxin n=1 Tax=Gorillibacterium timonense TaxID=1689269 RepID=UPI00071D95F9|nr:EFR1 family ferrodoxin [Gorillibacterium timonense]